jgi:integrase
MDPDPTGVSPTPGAAETALADPVDRFLSSKAKRGGDGEETGNYRRNLERTVEAWVEWASDHGVRTFADVDERVLRAYAQHLRDERDLAANTVRTYYAYVSSYLDWCRREGYLEVNPARRQAADEELPDDTGQRRSDQQFWTPALVTRLLRHANERAHEAVDERGTDAVVEVRDRGLAYGLAFSGRRVGELLRAEHDTRRTGVEWRDLALETATLEVLNKRQQYTTVSFPRRAHDPIRRWRRVLRPPSERWPVFPTRHFPTLRDRLVDALDVAPETLPTDPDALLARCRDADVRPPSLTTRGGRAVMQRLTEAADIDVPRGKHDHLSPHGARRGIGELTAREKGFGDAADLLDHASTRTTREFYDDVDAAETATAVDDVIDDAFGDSV